MSSRTETSFKKVTSPSPPAKDGQYGAACHGFTHFTYCVRDLYNEETRFVNMTCSHSSDSQTVDL